jgi:hypothetical protein
LNTSEIPLVGWANLSVYSRPLQNAPFCPISALGSNFNPQNTQCMDACPDFIGVVKIFACLEREPQLNIKNRFNGAGKIEHFSKVSIL